MKLDDGADHAGAESALLAGGDVEGHAGGVGVGRRDRNVFWVVKAVILRD